MKHLNKATITGYVIGLIVLSYGIYHSLTYGHNHISSILISLPTSLIMSIFFIVRNNQQHKEHIDNINEFHKMEVKYLENFIKELINEKRI